MDANNTVHVRETDRTEAFSAYARRVAAGEVTVPPLLLPPEERRLYVRRTLREDHRFRIENRPEGAQAKFDKLASSAFVFFRGTALLYYRDYAGTDMDLPLVLVVGDMHPENFGVMPNENGAPFFGVNDFDEACRAPFTYDVKRGAVGFLLAARENGMGKKAGRRVVRAWVEGYLEGLRAFASDDRERWFQYRIDNSPKMIRKLLKAALQERKEFLEEMIDLEKGRFLSTDEIVPYSKHVEEFQKAVDAYRESIDVATRGNEEVFFRVKDVAIKKGSGTASLGLDRYFLLIEGPSADPADNIVLELKQAERAALRALVPTDARDGDSEQGDTDAATDVVRAQDIHLVGGDPYYGRLTVRDQNFVVRERSPYKHGVDLEDLDAEEMEEYARLCGEVLSQTHARSDEDTGLTEGEIEQQILASLQPELFIDDMLRFAEAAAHRVLEDYRWFRKDHALGAFEVFPEPER